MTVKQPRRVSIVTPKDLPPKIVSVFDYTDFRQFLNHFYHRKKEDTGHFSYRYFSSKAGFSSHNVLKLVINGDRNIAVKSIPKFIKALGLTQVEGEHFRLMVLANQSVGEKEQIHFNALIRHKEGAMSRVLSDMEHRFYKDWYHPVMREVISLPQFRDNPDPGTVGMFFHPAITAVQVDDSLKLLQALNMIQLDENGCWEQCERGIRTTAEVSSKVIRAYNRKMVSLAEQSVERFDPYEREVSGMTLALSESMIQKMKKKIQEFKEEILADVLSDENDPESVYQLNFQLFPMVRNDNKK